ncbi:MAG: HD domain-containing phosphohydrolase [Calditrichia bacterium]
MNKPEMSSPDSQLQKLLNTVYEEAKLFADSQSASLKKLTQVGLALSSEKNIKKLLEMIVSCARDFTNADAGTLYIVDEEEQVLRFEIIQNDTLGTKLGGIEGGEINLPAVPLRVDGKPNHANVSSYCALTGETINIPDVYKAKDFDFTGPRKYDEQTGYRSRSMLVIPLKDHDNEIIGVLQLLNAIDRESNEVIAFAPAYTELVSSLASQAAIALENAQLIEELKKLFDSFIQGIATAIDEKSPYTGGHIRRVTELTMMMAHKINKVSEGPLGNKRFSGEELEELRIAAWLHDVGKITTPEFIIDKRNKLETIFDRYELIETRFELIKKSLENSYLREKIRILKEDKDAAARLNRMEKKFQEEMKTIEDDKAFIARCNLPGEFMSDDDLKQLRQIGSKTFALNGEKQPYLSENELQNLSIRKGSLTEEERSKIENHVLMSIKILEQLPFPKKLRRVPEIAGSHHEMMDGSGYPYGLKGDELPLQARIMAIADIFESLTAKDRPYKKPMKLSQTIKILEELKERNKIDPDLYDLFVNSGLLKEYAKKTLNPAQIDLEIS